MFIPKNEPIKGWMLVHCGQYIQPQRVPYEYVVLSNGSRIVGPVNICDNGNGSIACARCIGHVADAIIGTPIDQQLPAEIHLPNE